MKSFKILLLVAFLAIAAVASFTTPVDAMEEDAEAAGFDCSGEGDTCSIKFKRPNGSTAEIKGKDVVLT